MRNLPNLPGNLPYSFWKESSSISFIKKMNCVSGVLPEIIKLCLPESFQMKLNYVFRSCSRWRWIVFSGVIPDVNCRKWRRSALQFLKEVSTFFLKIACVSAVRRRCSTPSFSLFSAYLQIVFNAVFSGGLPELSLATTSIWCTEFSGVLPEVFLSTTFVPRFPSGLGRVVVNLLSQNEWNMGMIGFFLEDLTQF